MPKSNNAAVEICNISALSQTRAEKEIKWAISMCFIYKKEGVAFHTEKYGRPANENASRGQTQSCDTRNLLCIIKYKICTHEGTITLLG